MKRTRIAVLLGCALLMLTGCGDKTTEDGLTYRTADGEAVITGYEGESSVAIIPSELDGCPVVTVETLPDTVEAALLPDGVDIEGGSGLRCLVAGEDCSLSGLPDGCAVYEDADFSGLELEGLYLDSGAVFGLAGDSAVLLAVPESAELYAVPDEVNGCAVRYMGASALDGAEALTSLTLNSEMGFAAELLDGFERLGADIPEYSVTADYKITIEAAEAINAARAGTDLPEIAPDIGLVRAAHQRISELGEVYGFTRPDGSSVYDLLDELGVEYTLATGYNHHDSDYANMLKSMSDYIVGNESNPESPLVSELIGLAAGIGDDSAEYPYVMSGYVASRTQTTLTKGMVNYELRDGRLVPVSSTEALLSAVFPAEQYGREVAEPDPSFYESSPNLRAIQLGEGSAIDPQPPEGCAVIRTGDDAGYGTISGVYVVSSNGDIYVLSSKDCYIYWDCGSGNDSANILREIDGVPVRYIRSSAFDNADIDTIMLPDICGFEPDCADLFASKYKIYVYNADIETVSDPGEMINTEYMSVRLSSQLCDEINELRGSDSIRSSFELMLAAEVLASEQEELFGTTRPSGESWSSIFSERGVDWDQGRIFIKSFTDITEASSFIEQTAGKFAPVQEAGHSFELTAIGAFMGSEKLYLCALAITE